MCGYRKVGPLSRYRPATPTPLFPTCDLDFLTSAPLRFSPRRNKLGSRADPNPAPSRGGIAAVTLLGPCATSLQGTTGCWQLTLELPFPLLDYSWRL